MKNTARYVFGFALFWIALLVNACNSNNAAPISVPTTTDSMTRIAIQATSVPAAATPRALVSSTPPATLRNAEPTTVAANIPDWWPAELAMPAGTVLVGDTQRNAVWEYSDSNRDAIMSFLVGEGNGAGYNVYTTQDDIGPAIYFFKADQAFYLSVLTTQLIGNPIGAVHLTVSGALSSDFDLPLPQGTTVQHGDGFELKAFVRNLPCSDCSTAFALLMDTYSGPGTFADARAEVIPGANPTRADYKQGSCTVVVQTALNGTFDCRGMQNVYNAAQHIDAAGTWRLEAAFAPVGAAQPTLLPASEPTDAPVAAGTPAAGAVIRYQVSLSGAFNLSGSMQIGDQPAPCSAGAGIGPDALVAISGQTVAGHKLLFVPHVINMDVLFPKPGTYALDKEIASGIDLDDGAQGFVSDEGSSGSLTLNADGSGIFAFKDFKDERGGDKSENGTIAWACSR